MGFKSQYRQVFKVLIGLLTTIALGERWYLNVKRIHSTMLDLKFVGFEFGRICKAVN